MTLILNLPEKLEEKLRLTANQRNVSEAEVISQLLTEKLEPNLTLLESWLQETNPKIILEQQETWQDLKQGLEANRNTNRLLFPPDQKGKSW
jgi:hypothetical protein